jgi:hypothetical protein
MIENNGPDEIGRDQQPVEDACADLVDKQRACEHLRPRALRSASTISPKRRRRALGVAWDEE